MSDFVLFYFGVERRRVMDVKIWWDPNHDCLAVPLSMQYLQVGKSCLVRIGVSLHSNVIARGIATKITPRYVYTTENKT